MPIRRLPELEWPPLLRGLAAYGRNRQVARIEDFNADFRDGIGALPISRFADKRASAAICYLDAATRARPNLTIATGADEAAPDWPEGGLCTKPPVCEPCARLAVRWCPHLTDPVPGTPPCRGEHRGVPRTGIPMRLRRLVTCRYQSSSSSHAGRPSCTHRGLAHRRVRVQTHSPPWSALLPATPFEMPHRPC